MIKRFVLALCFVASFLGCARHPRPHDITVPQKLLIDSGRAVLPMRRLHGMATVDAPQVNGEPSTLIIDTGSSMAYFSDRLLQTFGRPTDRITQTIDAGGYVQRDRSLVEIASYSLGPITFENFHAAPLEPTGLRDYLGQSFDGALGMSLFRGCLFTLDYPNRQVIIERGSLSPGAETLPIHAVVDAPPQIEVLLGGLPVRAYLDSGFEAALELPRALADSIGWETRDRPAYFQNLSAPSAKTRGRLNADLQIGPHIISRPRVLVTERGNDVTIGSHVLQEFAVTFDQRAKLVRFVRPNSKVGQP